MSQNSRAQLSLSGINYSLFWGFLYFFFRIYAELQKLKSIVAEVEKAPISGRASIDGTLMSTVFGVVLVMILSVSVYAFIVMSMPLKYVFVRWRQYRLLCMLLLLMMMA